MVGVPNEGSVFVDVYEKLYRSLINKATKYKNIFNVNSKFVDNLRDGLITPTVPGIEYYVIAGTNPYELGKISELKFINVTHDGIVSVKSAQHVGDSYMNDRCSNYWEVPVTHTQLIDDDDSRRLIEKIVAEEVFKDKGSENVIGHTKYFEFEIDECSSDYKYIVVGREIRLEEVYDSNLCLCGNGVCGEGENSVNCPVDCVERFIITEITKIKWLWLVLLIAALIVSVWYYEHRGYKVNPILKRRIFDFEKLYKKEDEMIEGAELEKAVENYKRMRKEYIELSKMPMGFLQKVRIYSRMDRDYRKIKRFKDPIFRFDSLVRDTNKKINEKEIKEAVDKYKELREGYIELAKRSGMVKRRILYGKVLRVHKKLERLLKAKPSKSFWKSKKLKKR